MEHQEFSLTEAMKLLAKKPDRRKHKPNPFNKDRKYLEIKLVQDDLDKIFPVRDELIVNEYIAGNSINITLRLVTPMGQRDGLGSSVIRMYGKKPSGKSLIEARRIARSMALKNAAASFGNAFGRDLNRDGEVDAFKEKFVN